MKLNVREAVICTVGTVEETFASGATIRNCTALMMAILFLFHEYIEIAC